MKYPCLITLYLHVALSHPNGECLRKWEKRCTSVQILLFGLND